ncbi:PREDICTED: probable inactive receptor kinase At5g10020 [Nelumbo nucifera]|uniref:Probable inactive receptor kinase At5g10020 n=1 Tax=Nelumbo nucifera TaxID=4432 RepID=A0A1U8PZA4_NELNU|nr:PREDICTED: probable inactive receptor kinase At5g10020 [Nelumbo nucifera]
MYLHLHLHCFFIFFFVVFFSGVLASSEDEVRSLLEFKKGIRDDPHYVLESWDRSSVASNGCPRDWHGIACDESGSVAGIALDGLNLSGDLKFSTLSGLKMLRNLSLSGNFFTGRLVPAMGAMVSLQHLDLSRNLFYGPIPARINEIWTLNYLNLSSNNFTGGFPSGIRNLQQLRVLDLHSNGLWADIGDLLSELRNIEHVDLSYNMFYGELPLSADNISSLATTARYVNLSHNRLSGKFLLDDTIKSFRNLEVLDLGNNHLSGELPSFVSLSYLRVLRLGDNHLYGSIPGELFESVIPLEELDLSVNGFSGLIHRINSTTLKFLNLSSNMLSGPLPSTLGKCVMVDFSKNGLSGDISIMQSWGDTLEIIDLSSNALSGTFPILTYQFQRLSSIKIMNNSLRGDLPIEFGTYPRLAIVDLSSNELTGPIPSSFFTSLSLINLNISGNNFTGNKYDFPDNHPPTSEWKSSPGSPLSSSPRFIEACERPVMLNVYSPDRLAGELHFLDNSVVFTAEELSRAPAEVLGRSSHGTLYKATLDSGHMLTVKWLRVGLVKHKKEFAKEVKKIGSIRHPNIIPLRAYYWGPREQERLVLADYIHGKSLVNVCLVETTPRRYSPLSFSQRIRVAVDVARCLSYLHDRGLPHGNLKPTNILLAGPDFTARLTDYGLHRLMTPAGTAEQMLNLGALGYRAPEIASAAKPLPTLKADVYAFGVILMELLTRRSAGDIISGQSGAVDLTDWVRLCVHEGRGIECFDRDIAGGEEPTKAMDDLLAISLRCILPVNERPNIRQVFEDLCSISV